MFDDCVKLTLIDTCAALDTGSLIDHVNFLHLAGDAVNRAYTGTKGTANALVGDDDDLKQVRTDTGRTFLITDVGKVLIGKGIHGGQNRVRHGLTEATKCSVLDVNGEGLHFFKISLGTGAMGDLFKGLPETLGADTARGTFTAGLIHGEVEEELGDVDHAGIFVHDDHAAGAHHGVFGKKVVVVDGAIDVFEGQAHHRKDRRSERP